MARVDVDAGGRHRPVNFDDGPLPGRRYQAVVMGQVVDELTGSPLAVPVRVSSPLKGARPGYAANAVVGLVGVPERPFPKLDTQAYVVTVRFDAPGYQPVTAAVTLGPQPGFPATFVSADLGPLPARRTAVVLTGRTSRLGPLNRPVPLGGARVDITRLWRHTADLAALPVAGRIVAVVPGVYAVRPVGSTVRIVSLTPVAEPARSLLDDAPVGASSVLVSQTAGLAPGAIVGFDRGVADLEEHIAVDQVKASSDPASPGLVLLRHPTQRRHRAGTPAPRITPPAAGPATATITDPAQSGDQTAFVSAAGPFAGPQTVRVAGGTAADEFVTVRRYRTVSDGDGHYRLPPISRVAAVEVQGVSVGLHAGPVPFTPNYAVFENPLDLTLT